MKRFSFHALHGIKASSRQQQTRVIQVAAVAKHLKDLCLSWLNCVISQPVLENARSRSMRDKTFMFGSHLTSVEFIDVE